MKSFFVLIFLALFAIAATVDKVRYSAGDYDSRERLLIQEPAVMGGKIGRSVSGDFTYNPQNIPNPPMITRIEVLDRSGDGGKVTGISGGPGCTSTKLHFESKINKGYQFTVRLFGF